MPIRKDLRRAALVAATILLPLTATAQVPASLPSVVPLDVRNLTPRGNALGCDLEAADFGALLLRARCTGSPETASGLGARLTTAAPMAYTYDAIYVCATVNQDLADRTDVFGQPLRIRISTYFHELSMQADGSYLYVPRDTGLNATRRGVDFIVPTAAFAPRADGTVSCVTLKYAEGVQSGDLPPLRDGIWVPATQTSIFFSLPPLVPFATIPFTPGDSLAIAEIGLRVAGRRLPMQ